MRLRRTEENRAVRAFRAPDARTRDRAAIRSCSRHSQRESYRADRSEARVGRRTRRRHRHRRVRLRRRKDARPAAARARRCARRDRARDLRCRCRARRDGSRSARAALARAKTPVRARSLRQAPAQCRARPDRHGTPSGSTYHSGAVGSSTACACCARCTRTSPSSSVRHASALSGDRRMSERRRRRIAPTQQPARCEQLEQHRENSRRKIRSESKQSARTHKASRDAIDAGDEARARISSNCRARTRAVPRYFPPAA